MNTTITAWFRLVISNVTKTKIMNCWILLYNTSSMEQSYKTSAPQLVKKFLAFLEIQRFNTAFIRDRYTITIATGYRNVLHHSKNDRYSYHLQMNAFLEKNSQSQMLLTDSLRLTSTMLYTNYVLRSQLTTRNRWEENIKMDLQEVGWREHGLDWSDSG